MNELEETTSQEELELLLLLYKEKTGVLLLGKTRKHVKKVKSFAKTFNLDYKTVKGDWLGIIDRIKGRDTRMFKDSIFLTNDESNFDKLEKSEGEFLGFTEKSVGKFLGYPLNDARYYAEQNAEKNEKSVFQEFKKEARKLHEEGHLTEKELRTLNLVSYVPRPRIDRIDEALNKATNIKEILRQKDRELDYNLGETLIEENTKQNFVLRE